MSFFAIRKKIPIFTNQKFSFSESFTNCPQKRLFYVQKAVYSHKLSLFLPKITLFCPPPPIRTTLNLLFAKNTAVLLLFALILCCKAGASHRFKSSPAIPGKVEIPDAAGYMMNVGHFCESHVSSGDLNRPRSPEVRKPLACFLVLFARRKKNVKTSPLQEVPRFCKPRISTPQPQLRTATIKTFVRAFQGSANREAAHKTKNSHNPIKSFAAKGGHLAAKPPFRCLRQHNIAACSGNKTACRPFGRHAVRLILHPARRHTLLRRYAP